MRSIFDDKKNDWERLEHLLGELRGGSIRRRLSRTEVREFGELYRRAAADLAIARAESRDPRLINYLNSLVIRAHGQIYRSDRGGMKLLVRFFRHDLPAAFQANSRFVLIALVFFLIFAAFGYVATYIDLGFTHFVSLSGMQDEVSSGHQWWRSLNGQNEVGASFIMQNNIRVMIYVFSLGIFLGIGSFYHLAIEGARLGSIFAVCARLNPAFGVELGNFVVGHGVIELSCIYFCAAAGLGIGYAFIDPGDRTRAEALKIKGLQAAVMVTGCCLFLVVAGCIEGFLSPAEIPGWIKVLTGVGTGILLYSYLFLTPVDKDAANDETVRLER